jgi:superfamily II DNA or RNA helicase
VDAAFTVVLCPNSVVDVWDRTIRNAFPDSHAAIKTFDAVMPADTGFETTGHRYVILNYEMFQQPDSAEKVRRLVERENIDMVVIDEIQAVKQRDEAQLTRRRLNVAMLTSQAALRNPELRVLGMSATPVVNNLQEGRSLVELITGLEHPELSTQATLSNCMKLHQHLVRLGIREMPQYTIGLDIVRTEIDIADTLDEIRTLGSKPTMLELERILTRERLPDILKHVKRGTLIYTELIDGIGKQLRDAIVAAGFSVGFFTGEDKTGMDAFLDGDIDVLIGSSAIGTGVDGLQGVCDTLIFNVLPWTHAQYIQVLGRIFRQGQRHDVTVVLPLTYAQANDERWSWCESKLQRLEFKRSIADAAVDGVVPEGHLRSQQQALKDQLGWLARLERGEKETICRSPLVIPMPSADAVEDERRRVRYGEFSVMNGRINAARSETTHARFQANPDEFAEYHSRYREKRREWPLVPFEELIRYYADEQGLVIGDFGCGEADLAAALSDRHIVHSFDHVAIDDSVTACDVAHTPLEQASLDAAIFCLSLMGSNFADYIREAARVLKRDRVLHIYEATTRFGSTGEEVEANRRAFRQGLRGFGFDVVDVADHWKFTYIKAIRSGRAPLADATIAFKQRASESRASAAD